jgi:hypothetical protein
MCGQVSSGIVSTCGVMGCEYESRRRYIMYGNSFLEKKLVVHVFKYVTTWRMPPLKLKTTLSAWICSNLPSIGR